MRNYIENNNKNRVKIEGTLSEINLEYKNYNKNGTDVEAIVGEVKIRVDLADGKVLEVPVRMFSNKFTKDGKPSGAYSAIQKVKEEFTSIANCPDGGTPDCVRINSAQIDMQEYINDSGNVITYPSISGSFLSKISPNECRPQASFDVEAVVANIEDEIDRNGEETGRKKITTAIPGYKGKTIVVPFIAEHEAVKSAVESLWEVNSTVAITGDLNFSSTTEKTYVEMAFGAPKEETRTKSVSEFIITGGSEPFDEEASYDISDVQKGLAERKARLEALKEKKAKKTTTVAQKKIDLGF